MPVGALDTFPKLLMHHAAVRGARPAIREKDLGIWQTWTWQRFADEVRALACGLHAEGVRRGSHIALISDNRPRLYAAMCAVQCLGGVPVPLYQDAVAEEMVFPIQNAEIAPRLCRGPGAGRQASRDPAALSRRLKRIYYDDPRGLRHYKQAELRSYDDLLAAGSKMDARLRQQRDRTGQRRRRRRHVLHFGHHRGAEGRRAHPRQPARARRALRPRWSGWARTT